MWISPPCGNPCRLHPIGGDRMKNESGTRSCKDKPRALLPIGFPEPRSETSRRVSKTNAHVCVKSEERRKQIIYHRNARVVVTQETRAGILLALVDSLIRRPYQHQPSSASPLCPLLGHFFPNSFRGANSKSFTILES